MNAKPPIGLKPRLIHEEERRIEIRSAIIRYMYAGKMLPNDWIAEYNELVSEKEDDN